MLLMRVRSSLNSVGQSVPHFCMKGTCGDNRMKKQFLYFAESLHSFERKNVLNLVLENVP